MKRETMMTNKAYDTLNFLGLIVYEDNEGDAHTLSNGEYRIYCSLPSTHSERLLYEFIKPDYLEDKEPTIYFNTLHLKEASRWEGTLAHLTESIINERNLEEAYKETPLTELPKFLRKYQ